MDVKPLVGIGGGLPVKSLLAHSVFATRHQQNGLALWIECESDPPFAIRAKPQLLVPSRDRFARNTWLPKFQIVLLLPEVHDLAA